MSDGFDILPQVTATQRVFDRLSVTEERAYYVERGMMEEWERLSQQTTEALDRFRERHPDYSVYEQRMIELINSGAHAHRPEEGMADYIERLYHVARSGLQRVTANQTNVGYAASTTRWATTTTEYAPQQLWDAPPVFPSIERVASRQSEMGGLRLPKKKKEVPPVEEPKKRMIKLKEE